MLSFINRYSLASVFSTLKVMSVIAIAAFSIVAQAAPTSAQYELINRAVDAQLSQAAARVAAASALTAGPMILRGVGQVQMALALREVSRLTRLKQETQMAQSNGQNPPQAAVDMAMQQATARLSLAIASRNFALLGLYSAQVSQIASLNQAIQLGNAYAERPVVRPTPVAREDLLIQQTGPVIRRPASIELPACERRGARNTCFRNAQTIR